MFFFRQFHIVFRKVVMRWYFVEPNFTGYVTQHIEFHIEFIIGMECKQCVSVVWFVCLDGIQNKSIIKQDSANLLSVWSAIYVQNKYLVCFSHTQTSRNNLYESSSILLLLVGVVFVCCCSLLLATIHGNSIYTAICDVSNSFQK